MLFSQTRESIDTTCSFNNFLLLAPSPWLRMKEVGLTLGTSVESDLRKVLLSCSVGYRGAVPVKISHKKDFMFSC